MSAPRLPPGDAVRALAALAILAYGIERYAQRLGRRIVGAPPREPQAGRPLPTTAEAAR